MRRITEFVNYYPNCLFFISLTFFVYAVLYAFVCSPIDAMYRSIETVPGEVFEDERLTVGMSEILIFLLIGRPWLALGIGLVAGMVAFAWRKRYDERRISELVSQETARVLKRVRERSFAGVKSNYPLILAILTLIVCSVGLEFSLKISLIAMGATMWVLYPIDRRIFDAVVKNLSDPELDPAEREKGSRWIRRRRNEAIFSAVAFPAMSLLMVVIFLSYVEPWV